MREQHLEAKVGTLVLLAIVGVVGLLWLMGEVALSPGPTLTVEFGHTGNVVVGAPVKLGGVKVGRVDKIALVIDRRDEAGNPLPVRMLLSVRRDVLEALHEDSAVTVATQGPLGEPYLELYTGSSRSGKLGKGASIRGVDAPRLDVVANQLSSFLQSASHVLEEDPQAIARLVGGVSGLSRTVDDVLTENRGDIHVVASELAGAAKDLSYLAQLARKTMEPGGQGMGLIDDSATAAHLLRQDLPEISKEAKVVLAALSALSADLGPEDGKKLRSMIDRYASAGEQLEKIAVRGERILGRIESGEGTLGGFNQDPQVYRDLRDLVADLKKHPWKIMWKD